MLNFLLQASNTAANVATDAAPVVTDTQSGPAWLTALVGVIATVVTVFLVPWLRQKANAARAEAESYKADSINTQISTKDMLADQAKQIGYSMAASLAEKRFPALAAKVASGELKMDGPSIKKELYSWGAALKAQIIEHFDGQGINIVTALGDKYLDQLVEWAANKVSPFPGKDTAKALLTEWDGKAIEWLATKGVDWVKKRTETENASGV